MLLDAFLKFEEPTLPGESTDTDHGTEIEILSYEQSIVRPAMDLANPTDPSRVRSQHSALTVYKPLCKASPKLYQAACAGTVYKKVTLSVCQPGGTSKTTSDRWNKIEYLQVKLGTVHISRVHLVGDPALHYFGRATQFPIAAGSVLDMGPIEEIDLTYQTIEWLYKGGTGKLNINGKWNLLTNSPS